MSAITVETLTIFSIVLQENRATEWRESGISIDLIARLLGHKKTDVTEQRYIKYRPELFSQIKDKMDVYGINNGTDMQR